MIEMIMVMVLPEQVCLVCVLKVKYLMLHIVLDLINIHGTAEHDHEVVHKSIVVG